MAIKISIHRARDAALPEEAAQQAPASPLPASTQKILLSPKEVADLLGIPTTTLAIWRSTGRVQIPFIKIGRHVRYRFADLRRFLDATPEGAIK